MTDKPHSQKNQQPSKQVNRLKVAFLLSSCYLVSAVNIVLITGSLSLLSEAGHMLADVGGLALAIFAIDYTRKPPTLERTKGFFRIEILARLQTVWCLYYFLYTLDLLYN